MGEKKETLYEKTVDGLQNKKLVVFFLIAAAVIVGLSKLIQAGDTIGDVLRSSRYKLELKPEADGSARVRVNFIDVSSDFHVARASVIATAQSRTAISGNPSKKIRVLRYDIAIPRLEAGQQKQIDVETDLQHEEKDSYSAAEFLVCYSETGYELEVKLEFQFFDIDGDPIHMESESSSVTATLRCERHYVLQPRSNTK